MDARSADLHPDSLPEAVPSPLPDGSGWRGERGEPSLAGMFATVRTAKQGPFWRKLLAFLGPGYLVAVGYMDPGNWATSLAGGSKFGYALLSIALLSKLGYQVVASTGREDERPYLQELGADTVIARDSLSEPSSRPIRYTNRATACSASGSLLASRVRMSSLMPDTPSNPDSL